MEEEPNEVAVTWRAVLEVDEEEGEDRVSEPRERDQVWKLEIRLEGVIGGGHDEYRLREKVSPATKSK